MENQNCIFFRKPSSNRSNIRKRSIQPESSSESEPENPNPSHKPNKNSSNKKLLFSTTSKPVPKPESEPGNPLSSSSSSSSFYFESSKEIQTHHDSRATATLETETDFSNDARAIRERALKRAEANLRARPSGSTGPEAAAAAAAEEKVYKGINGYTDYKAGFRREQTVAGEKAGGAHGPLRASAHIRTSARFDYQPDICKDYKETGYCGFGDACKFMHDRGDYKSGWQMEKEWEEKEKARKRALAMGGGGDDEDNNDDDDDDDSDEDALPFACFICRQPFEDPVVTKCKHYFCEHCALKHHSKNKKCFVCNKPTLGIFNTAHEIRKRMAQEK